MLLGLAVAFDIVQSINLLTYGSDAYLYLRDSGLKDSYNLRLDFMSIIIKCLAYRHCETYISLYLKHAR